ncbi:hypothetical protein CERSUDRAFT_91926 [Gelatoporia subvermispora B]|uniref:Uncharacterized protein n=1 Tax=Ceriporiopsis subvermispora (strain B) TaxID=914234 RepID=M2RQK5_CERS8|nr:hypothetical protein CERSUDRAFT_91926 [Gelatoporia subvermispora B]
MSAARSTRPLLRMGSAGCDKRGQLSQSEEKPSFASRIPRPALRRVHEGAQTPCPPRVLPGPTRPLPTAPAMPGWIARVAPPWTAWNAPPSGDHTKTQLLLPAVVRTAWPPRKIAPRAARGRGFSRLVRDLLLLAQRASRPYPGVHRARRRQAARTGSGAHESNVGAQRRLLASVSNTPDAPARRGDGDGDGTRWIPVAAILRHRAIAQHRACLARLSIQPPARFPAPVLTPTSFSSSGPRMLPSATERALGARRQRRANARPVCASPSMHPASRDVTGRDSPHAPASSIRRAGRGRLQASRASGACTKSASGPRARRRAEGRARQPDKTPCPSLIAASSARHRARAKASLTGGGGTARRASAAPYADPPSTRECDMNERTAAP